MNDNINFKSILKNLTILYIEDENNIRESLEKTLNLIFKNVISTSNAEDALELFENNHIDIILSDINLPQMNGLDFSQKLREQNHNIPIILLTAYTDKKFLLQATKLKLINYLTKPINFDELYQTFCEATKEIIKEGKYRVNLSSTTHYDVINHLLYENNIEIDLSINERKLLDLFIVNKNKTVTTQEIKNNIWDDYEKATDSALKSLLNKLRKKIGLNSIKNVSGIGYHLVIL